MKLRHDLAGHYNRPDVFRLLVNKGALPLMQTVAGDELAAPTTPILDMSQPAELEAPIED